MPRIGFCGPTYISRSPLADNQRCVNLVPEKIESETGKSAFALNSAPGTKIFSQVADAPSRGQLAVKSIIPERSFVVCGESLFEIFADGSKQFRFAVVDDGNAAFLEASATHLVVASGGHAYVMTLATNAFSELTAGGGQLAGISISQIAWTDSFFVALESPQTNRQNKIYASNASDGTTWAGASSTAPNVYQEQTLAIVADHREIILCGAKRCQSYYNSGASPFPLDIAPGEFAEQGINDPAGLVRADNTIFGIGADERGARIAFRLQGYTPTRISTHSVEQFWQSYKDASGGISTDAVGMSYQLGGHIFVSWYFPSANNGRGATWVYDITIGLWFERDHVVNNVAYAHQARTHAFSFGKHLVGAWDSGTIYEMSFPVLDLSVPGKRTWQFCDDAGMPMRIMRRTPTISVENERITHRRLTIDVETGLGPLPPLTDGGGNARDPQLMMRISNDAGRNFGNIHTANCGKAGETLKRAIFWRLGQSRNRVYEITATDAVPWRFVDAYLGAKPGYMPAQTRMTHDLVKRA